MLSLNLLEAVLQGLSPIYLDHLDNSWVHFCFRIQRAMQNGHPPLEALKLALSLASVPELKVIGYSALQAQYVLPLTDLSFRQKELLIALRTKSVTSTIELSRILNWERSHTHQRLKSLVQKGYAVKFYGEKGPRYFAAERSLGKSVKYQALQVILNFVSDGTPPSPSNSSTATSVTSATFATPVTPVTNATWPPDLYTAADVMNLGAPGSLPVENTS